MNPNLEILDKITDAVLAYRPKLMNEFVHFVNQGTKRAKYADESGSNTDWLKLHQFIEENAKEELRDHLSKITGFLQIAKNRQDFIESFVALFGGGKQQKWSEFDESFS